jgi:hypothetical protein
LDTQHASKVKKKVSITDPGLPAQPYNNLLRVIAALTNGTDRQSFQFRKPRRLTERGSLLAAITRYAPCVSLAAKEAPNLVRKTCQLASHFGGRIDRRDISSFNGILVQL